MWQPSDRFWRPEIRLATDFCDVAQTLYKYWFGHRFDLLRRLPRDQHVNITKDVCKKSPSPPGPASPASPASQPPKYPTSSRPRNLFEINENQWFWDHFRPADPNLQTWPNLLQPSQTVSNLIKPSQTFSILLKPSQTFSNLLKPSQIITNLL